MTSAYSFAVVFACLFSHLHFVSSLFWVLLGSKLSILTKENIIARKAYKREACIYIL